MGGGRPPAPINRLRAQYLTGTYENMNNPFVARTVSNNKSTDNGAWENFWCFSSFLSLLLFRLQICKYVRCCLSRLHILCLLHNVCVVVVGGAYHVCVVLHCVFHIEIFLGVCRVCI